MKPPQTLNHANRAATVRERPSHLLALSALLAFSLHAQTPTFTTGAQLVVETVSVTGKNGQPIEGLTAKDFTITENGVPQQIRFCEYQKLGEQLRAPQNFQPHIYDKLGRTQIAPEPPGDSRYRDRRLLALYLDMTAMPPADQFRAIEAAEKFVRTQMTTNDVMAILRYTSGSVDVLQDFTDDRDRLLSILETLAVGEGQGLDESADDASTPDTGAAFGQDDSEFNIFNTDRQLSALQTAAQMLGRLREKKLLIYFASGLRLNGLDNQAQLQATIQAAIRSNVAFWPIDARGLVAQAPLGDATKGSPGNLGMYTGAAALAVTTNLQQSQDTLYALASDTGGKALLDYNDLAKGIVQAQQSISSYYVLGYYTTNTAQDGKFRQIKISLNSPLSAKLDYRQGYFAGKEFSKFTAADKERQLEEALMLPDPITDLTIAMEIDYFQLNRAEYFVPLVVKIPGRELALAKRGGAERSLIDFIGEVKDEFGTTITNVRDKVDVKLTDETAAQLAKRPIEYDTGFTLLPGKYTIKFLARDAETGRIGTYQTTFVIPNLNKEDQRIPTSSVVLSSQQIDMKDALYNVMKSKDQTKEEAVNPLLVDGKKLIPSVTRVFNRQRDLYVYLQAYEPDNASVQPLVAYVSFYRDQKKAFETAAIAIKDAWKNRLKTMPVQFDIPLSGLAPGTYDCQVSLLDPSGQKAAFWQTPVVVQ
ncbi:MAG TPA: VWA domain-containing protein [Bryobacteraceae bacterium]|jgi:VWFA-related protein|nr:VWA domain-containing protein [Bryobacteraceae bacterium]